MTSALPIVSVVIPAYNAAAQLADRIGHLKRMLNGSGFPYELLIVDDGSTDDTAAAVRGLEDACTRGVFLPRNLGKFGALKAGMALTRGRACVFMDADVPYALDALPGMVTLVLDRGFHIVVGDRTLPQSRYSQDLGAVRRAATQTFTQFVRLLVTGGLHDTQCGMKAFRGDVARALFPLVHEDGFAGDVELLYVAIKHNLAVRRFPVRLEHHGPSTVRPVAHGLGMLVALAALRGRHRAGRYDSSELDRIVAESYGGGR